MEAFDLLCSNFLKKAFSLKISVTNRFEQGLFL
jgi:hypothetical protein